MSRVLMIGPGRNARGGIVKVIEYYKTTPFWRQEDIFWIETHTDGERWQKLKIFIVSIIQFLSKVKNARIVHLHFTGRNSANRKIVFFLLSKIFGLKIVSHLHSPILNFKGIMNWSFKSIVKNSDIVIVLSNAFIKVLNDEVINRDYIVLNNPSQGFYFSEDKKEDIILFAGRLEKQKGYHDLIQALGLINQLNGYHVVLAGNGEIQEANRLIDYLQLGDVRTVGWLNNSDIIEMYKKARIFVLPSYGEGFPISLIDALSYKCAVITTPVGGIPDSLRDGETCLFFNPGDVGSLAQALEKLIKDEKLRKHLVFNGYKLAKESFDIERITDKLSTIYTLLLE